MTLWTPRRHFNAIPTTSSRIDRSHPLARGLVGYWPMLEGTGDTLHDFGANNNDAVYQGTGSVSWVVDQGGWVPNLSGADDQKFYTPTNVRYPYSLSAWWRGNDLGLIVAVSDQTGPYYDGLYIDSSANVGVLQYHGTVQTATPFDGTTLDWRHISVVFNSTSSSDVYVDGKYQGSNSSSSGTADQNFTRLSIGGTADLTPLANYLLTGTVGNVMSHDRALTPSEISHLYRDPWALFRRPRATVLVADTGAGTDVDCTLSTITWVANAATIKVDSAIGCTLGTVTWSANAATIKVDSDVDCTLGTITWGANAATVKVDSDIGCTLGTVTWSANAATIKVDSDVDCTLGTITWGANAATVKVDSDIGCTLGTVTWSANSATVVLGTSIDCTLGTITWAANAATVNAGANVDCTLSTVTWAANSATVNARVAIDCTLGTITWAANAATIDVGTNVDCTLGAIVVAALGATVVAPTAPTAIDCTVGTVAIAAKAATIRLGEVPSGACSVAFAGAAPGVAFAGAAPGVTFTAS